MSTPNQLSADVYFLINNASRIGPDVAWLQARAAEFKQQGKDLSLD